MYVEVLSFAMVMMVVFNQVEGAPQRSQYDLGPHAAVVRNAQLESRLPSHLRNPFYQDPRTARALAYSSWITPEEQPVRSYYLIDLCIFVTLVCISHFLRSIRERLRKFPEEKFIMFWYMLGFCPDRGRLQNACNYFRTRNSMQILRSL